MARRALLFVAVLAITSATTASASRITPQRLYTTLLTSAYPVAELPDGFSSPKVGYLEPGSQGRKYHVVGEVEVDVDGPDASDAIAFFVFPSATDALADFRDPKTVSGEHVIGKAPGYTLPSQLTAGSITGKNAFGKTVTNGATSADVVVGNVVVAGFTASSDNASSGNVPSALALLRSGVAHLARARG